MPLLTKNKKEERTNDETKPAQTRLSDIAIGEFCIINGHSEDFIGDEGKFIASLARFGMHKSDTVSVEAKSIFGKTIKVAICGHVEKIMVTIRKSDADMISVTRV